MEEYMALSPWDQMVHMARMLPPGMAYKCNIRMWLWQQQFYDK
jgi:hypothetical protein